MAKITYRSRSTVLCSPSNSSGSRYRTDFCESLDARGVYTVIEEGKTDLQEYINSFFDSVDIYSILTRILRGSSGSSDVLSKLDEYIRLSGNTSGGIYADVSGIPDNIHELNKGYSSMIKFFSSLPSDVRLQYHNSVDEFVAQFDDFVSRYSSIKNSVSDEQLESVVSDDG